MLDVGVEWMQSDKLFGLWINGLQFVWDCFEVFIDGIGLGLYCFDYCYVWLDFILMFFCNEKNMDDVDMDVEDYFWDDICYCVLVSDNCVVIEILVNFVCQGV